MTQKFLFLLAILAVEAAYGDSNRKLSMEEKVKNSSIVAHGHVRAIDSQLVKSKEGGNIIMSRVRFEVQEPIKGDPDSEIDIEIIGGTINAGDPLRQRTMQTSDSPSPRVGDEVVVLLGEGRELPNAYSLKDGGQSYLKVDKQKRTFGGKSVHEIRTISSQGGRQ